MNFDVEPSAAPKLLERHVELLPDPAGADEVVISGFSKTFGNRRVLQNFEATFAQGTVHGLVGANGSGKSTLIKILAGYHDPDHGQAELQIRGERYAFPVHHSDRRRIGIGFVHQDLGLAGEVSVAENLFIDALAPRPLSRVPWRALNDRAELLLGRVGGDHIRPADTINQLIPVDRAIVAIARAISELVPRGLLVLDEVTTFLPRDGVELLFQLMRDVCAEGTSVLLVSHRLEEIRAACEAVTVLRNGAVVASRKIRETSEETLVTDIVGSELADLYPHKGRPGDATRFCVENLRGHGFGPISFAAKQGEIIGVTGLRGMGHERLPYALYGDTRATGSIRVEGVTLDLRGAGVVDVLKAGVRLVPGDRLRQGAVASATVQENATLPFIREFFKRGRLRRGPERVATEKLLDAYGVAPRDPSYLYSRLSGGNQQKVLLGRWLRTTPKVLLLDEPTQGVDIGARRDLFARIVQAAEEGATVIYVSTETQDLAELCHRVLVFRDGTVARALERGEVTEENILRACWISDVA